MAPVISISGKIEDISFDIFNNLKQSSHAEQKFVFDERLTFGMALILLKKKIKMN